MKKSHLVLFDFDGTITTKDTLLEFIKFYHGPVKFLLGFTILSPILVLFKLGFVKNQVAKEMVLRLFFEGTPVADFERKCMRFVKEKVPALIKSSASKALQAHLDEGATVVIVSASPENWVRIWSETIGIQCIATQLEVTESELITGRIKGKNCYGQEKVNRVAQLFDISQFEITAYGDSRGDSQMLEIAQHAHYQRFSD